MAMVYTSLETLPTLSAIQKAIARTTVFSVCMLQKFWLE